MGEMRDSDWSREILLRSDWSGPRVAISTTGIHGSDCHKPFPQSDLHKFSLCLREVGERNIIKVAGDRKSRIFIWNVAEPLQR